MNLQISLCLARYLYGDGIDYLTRYGLDKEVGNWALWIASRRIRRTTIWALPLGSSIPLGLASNFGSEEARTFLVIIPFALILTACSFLLFDWQDKRENPGPDVLLVSIMAAADDLASLADFEPICASKDGKWKDYLERRRSLINLRERAQENTWAIARQTALIAGFSVKDCTKIDWSYTARIVLRCAEKPFMEPNRAFAAKACSAHILHLRAGHLFDPVPRDSSIALPELRRPRVQNRLHSIVRNPQIITVTGGLVASTISPVLNVLLR